MFVDPDGSELASMRSVGLVETYGRTHPGQGTENVCFCFDNIFLECLWVTDPDEVRSAAIRRTALYERSQWRTLGTSRFGVAWRGAADGIPTWKFAPPYLPAGMTIDVAVDSDDPLQPMLFRSPGTAAPMEWPAARRGDLQHGAGFGRVLSVMVRWPLRGKPGPALQALAAATILDLSPAEDDAWSVVLEIERGRSQAPLRLELPQRRAAGPV
jgi:hypothetical protein